MSTADTGTPTSPQTPQDRLPPGGPDLERAVELALRAPSVHNTQPWRWRIGRDHVELHADRNRQLVGTDPDGRDLMISCGAALHHLRVALAGLGAATDVERLPDPEDRDHLATVRTRTGPPDRTEAALFGQLGRRHTDRRPFSSRPVPPATLSALGERAAKLGASLHPIIDAQARQRLETVLAEAAARQPYIFGYPAELAIWTRRYAGARDGVPPSALPGPGARAEGPGLRRFPTGRLTAPQDVDPNDDAGVLMVLTTPRDDELDRLRAGEATSAVLLAATRSGLASVPLSQSLEVVATREQLRRDVLGVPDEPQLVIRVGWAREGAAALAETPRRRLTSVLLPGR
ncbi:Acg family FMN-binding oxidoreductase [Pseudonocardia sp. H11422]|uniref:Acg family FMN-binding oxidoreductase n=1 Tax=Pseudonocardia sp. H11422 TaxID=2835866 RepID=UPI001BDBC25C|nr:nitroreductase family protein [Pseudonocardia sp. H11422]